MPVIWQLSRHLSGNSAHPVTRCPHANLRQKIFPFQLGLLCREVLLHGTSHGEGRSLSVWRDLAAALNAIMAYGEEVSLVTAENFQLELHRIGQQQIPLQKSFSIARFMRYVSLYEHAEVAPILERIMGMCASDYSFLGFVTFTQVMKASRFVTNLDLKPLGISGATRDRFFARMSDQFSQVRIDLERIQKFDHTWQYTFNVLDDKPLIGFDPRHPERVYCPDPERTMTRFTEGAFYLLIDEKDFGNAFGRAFEEYIGKVIQKARITPRLSVYREQIFKVGKNDNHGVDFVLSDATGNVFVECKAKRIALAGRIAKIQKHLDGELEVLAKAVVQNYRNIRLALDGRTLWTKNGNPSINFVVTLTDWNLLSPQALYDLHVIVVEMLDEKGLIGIQEEIPYAIVSAEAFEAFCCAVGSVDIIDVIGSSFTARAGEWQLAGQLYKQTPDAFQRAERLFLDEFAAYGNKISKGTWRTPDVG